MSIIYIGLILILVVYLPGINYGIITLHLEDLLILFGFLFIRLLKRKRIIPSSLEYDYKNFTIKYIILLLWIYCISLTALIYGNDMVAAATIFKLLSMLRPLLFIFLIFRIIQTNKAITQLVGLLVIIVIVQLVIMVCQKLNLFGINEWLTPLYSLIYKTSKYSILGFRADGTFGNPNDAGVAMVPLGILIYSYYLSNNDSVIYRWLSGLLALAIFTVIILATQSRTAVMGLISGYFTASCISVLNRNNIGVTRKLNVVLFVGVIILILYTTLWNSLEIGNSADLGSRYAVLLGKEGLTSEGSFSARMVMWKTGLSKMLPIELITGRGLSEYLVEGYFDGGYVSYYYVGGIFLITAFLSLTIMPSLEAWRLIKTSIAKNKKDYLQLSVASMGVSILIMTVSHPIIFADKIWLMYLCVYSLYFIKQKIDSRIHY